MIYTDICFAQGTPANIFIIYIGAFIFSIFKADELGYKKTLKRSYLSTACVWYKFVFPLKTPRLKAAGACL